MATTTNVQFGITGLQANRDSNNAAYITAQQVIVSQAGTLLSLSLYLNPAVGNVKLGLYDAKGGTGSAPGNKLAETGSAAAVVGWNTLPVLAQISVPAGTYYLAYEVSSNTTGFLMSPTGPYYYGPATFGTMPALFQLAGANTGGGTEQYSFYMTMSVAVVVPPPPPPPPPPPNSVTIPISVNVTDQVGTNMTVWVQSTYVAGVITSTQQQWQTLLTGGGGFMTGVDIDYTWNGSSIQSTGTILARTDTTPGPYLWSNSQNQWLPLATGTSMPNGFNNGQSGISDGCWAARIAPSKPATLYAVMAFNLWASTNSGATWSIITNFTASYLANAEGNFGNRMCGHWMAVDPQNDQVLYVGTPDATGKLQRSFDGGATWSTAPTVAASGSSPVGILVTFDFTSSVSGGKQQIIYAASWGNGVYRSTDGGTTFTLLNTANMPTAFITDMKVDKNGKLWVCSDGAQGGSGLWTWTPSAWVHVGNATTDVQAHTIAIEPVNAQKLILIGTGGRMLCSNDGGATWPQDTAGGGTLTLDGTGDALWLGTPFSQTGGSWGMSTAQAVFDPSQTNIAYWAWGFGMNKCTFPASLSGSGTIAWQSVNRGINGLDGHNIIHPPWANSKIIGAAFDLQIWYDLNTKTYPTAYRPAAQYNGPEPIGSATPCSDLDWAKDGSTTIISAAGGNFASVSTDGGNTWTQFSDQTPFSNAGGSNVAAVAASTSLNFIAGSPGTSLYYTTDGQATAWKVATYAGNVHNGNVMCADGSTANTFYIYSAVDGVYRSTNSGQTWTKRSSFIFTGNSNNPPSPTLKGVFGVASHVWGAAGFIDANTQPDTHPGLAWSIDGGATFTLVANWTACTAVDFGKIAPGQTYPTVFAAGAYNGVVALWMCQNFNPSTGAGAWTQVGNTQFPTNIFTVIVDIAGDPNIVGACSIAFGNGGFARFA